MKQQSNLRRMLWLRHASFLEGCTLLGLLTIAVPLKYLGGMPGAVAVVGPLHGAAFLIFIALLAVSAKCTPWTGSELLRLTIGAFVPFGALVNAGLLQQKALTMQLVARPD